MSSEDYSPYPAQKQTLLLSSKHAGYKSFSAQLFKIQEDIIPTTHSENSF